MTNSKKAVLKKAQKTRRHVRFSYNGLQRVCLVKDVIARETRNGRDYLVVCLQTSGGSASGARSQDKKAGVVGTRRFWMSAVEDVKM